MHIINRVPLLAILAGVSSAALCAAPKTLDRAYFGAAEGPLRQATLARLPAGVIVSCGNVTITTKELEKQIGDAPDSVKAELKKNSLYVVEQLLIQELLTEKAKEWSRKSGTRLTSQDPGDIINAYMGHVLGSVKATEAEKKEFLRENAEVCEGVSKAEANSYAEQQVVAEKRKRAAYSHIDSLAKGKSLRIDSAWCKRFAPLAMDNPVSKARRSGKPALVDFGSKGCIPCDKLAPILDKLRKVYAGRCSVLFVSVRDDRVLAQRYGIQTIPVQVFFDARGREVYRHTGFWPEARLKARIAALGVR